MSGWFGQEGCWHGGHAPGADRNRAKEREGNGEMLNICVSGATGWTGRELVRGVLEAEDMTLTGAVARRAAG